MMSALGLARRGLGNVWPNPAVGCVLVKDGNIVGRGWTQPTGRPHAETEALNRAGEKAQGATAYVTLEPCNHHGQTPPCTEALIGAGVKKVFVATQDPDPRVSGQGLDRLQDAEIEIDTGICKKEADRVNAGFLSRIGLGRPFITLKTATTLDGRIALASGESQWITGESARRAAHGLRATHDAIMIGSGTSLKDNPNLCCRLPGVANDRRPRIVLDGRLRTPENSELVQSAHESPVWIIVAKDHAGDRIESYREKNVTIIEAPVGADGHPDLDWSIRELGARGLTRILVEGGGQLAASLLRGNFVDQLAWFRASSIIGQTGISAIGEIGLENLMEMPKFRRLSSTDVGDDRLEIFIKNS